MTVDFILHGVPNGQDFWGASDDNHYFSTFYVQKNEKEFLSIEARKVSGKTYCYYNYLKYNNVTAADGRAGAYLGITLRFDAYYKDIFNVYQLFEIIYNNLLDTILDKNGDGIKFKLPKFEAADRELNDIKKKVVSLIQNSATAKDFTPLDNSFFGNEDKTIQAFLLDCTPENVFLVLKKYRKIEVSKYYPSKNESRKMRSIEERFTSTITQKDKDLEEKNQQISKLKDECQGLKTNLSREKKEVARLDKVVSEKNNTIKEYEAALKQINEFKALIKELKDSLQAKEKENNQLKIEISHIKDNRKISDMVKEIRMPLITLANYAGRQSCSFPDDSRIDSNKDTSSDNKVYKKNQHKDLQLLERPIFQIAKMIVLFLILCLTSISAYLLCFATSKSENPEKFEYIKSYVIDKEKGTILSEDSDS